MQRVLEQHAHVATPLLSAGLSVRVLEYDGLICATRTMDNRPYQFKDEGNCM